MLDATGCGKVKLSMPARENGQSELLCLACLSEQVTILLELKVAMVTADGSPLKKVPPPGGVVRVGVACEQYISNTSVEQLFFVLDLCACIDNVSDRMAMVGKTKRKKMMKNESSDHGSFSEKVPADTAITLALKTLKLTFLESSCIDIQGTPLVQFIGDDLSIQVAHRTLGAAMAISSNLRWERVQVDSAETDRSLTHTNGIMRVCNKECSLNGCPEMRAVFWVQNRSSQSNGKTISPPFLNLTMVHVIPYDAQDTTCHSFRASACIRGVRLAGGMNYNEALLQRFGILKPDGSPGAGLSKGLEHLSSGPLSKLFKASPPFVDEIKESQNESIEDDKNSSYLHFGPPDDVNITLELKDWLFALEGAEVMAERRRFNDAEDSCREDRSWHTSFESFKVKASGSKTDTAKGKGSSIGAQKTPIEVVRVGVEGLKAMKPQREGNEPTKGVSVEPHGGVHLEVDIVSCEDNHVNGMITWVVENLKISVKQPIEVVVRKDEFQHFAHLCKLEADSVGRMTVGILRLLKLDETVGQAAIDQLSHLGSEGLEEIFSPRKHSSIDHHRGPSSLGNECSSFDSTIASLEAALLESESSCATLSAQLTTSETSKTHVQTVEQLAQNIESMQRLLSSLRNRV